MKWFQCNECAMENFSPCVFCGGQPSKCPEKSTKIQAKWKIVPRSQIVILLKNMDLI